MAAHQDGQADGARQGPRPAARPRRPRQWSVIAMGIGALLLLPGVAVATHVFSDVGDGSSHAPGIEYVAETGITAGCDEDRYCPSDELTRAQMATFLFRASGHDPETPASVNAAELEGDAPEELLVRAASGEPGGGTITVPDGTNISSAEVQRVALEAPGPGLVQFSGSVEIENTGSVPVDLQTLSANVDTSHSGLAANETTTLSYTGHLEVDEAGEVAVPVEVSVRRSGASGTDTVLYSSSTLNLRYVPAQQASLP